MIDIGLFFFRFLHYGAAAILAGVAVFSLCAFSGDEPEEISQKKNRLLLRSAIVALISGVGWFAFTVANMGGGISDVADAEVLAFVIGDTVFGVVWMVRAILGTILVFIVAFYQRAGTSTSGDLLVSLLAGAFLASLAGVGHTQVGEGWRGAFHVGADALHLLAAGAWLGGLVLLGLLLNLGNMSSVRCSVDVENALMRFSGVGYAAVAGLIGTGLVNGWMLVGSVSGLLTSYYGRILLVKLVCFVGMLGLAVVNRLWLVPALLTARADSGGVEFWQHRLRSSVLGEQGLGILVLLCVSALGMIRPAVGQ